MTTYIETLYLTEIIRAAQSNRQVRRWIDGYVTIGQADAIRAADGSHITHDTDIMSACLHVQTMVSDHLWPISELVAESNPDTWSSDGSAFLIDNH